MEIVSSNHFCPSFFWDVNPEEMVVAFYADELGVFLARQGFLPWYMFRPIDEGELRLPEGGQPLTSKYLLEVNGCPGIPKEDW